MLVPGAVSSYRPFCYNPSKKHFSRGKKKKYIYICVTNYCVNVALDTVNEKGKNVNKS